jgi:hypothetical protein
VRRAESSTLHEKCFFSTCAFISLGVVLAASVEFCSNRLLTASVSNGGPLSCVPALVFSAVNSVSKPKKTPRFSLPLPSSLPAISARTKPKVCFYEWTCIDGRCNEESRFYWDFFFKKMLLDLSQMLCEVDGFSTHGCFLCISYGVGLTGFSSKPSGSVEADCFSSLFLCISFFTDPRRIWDAVAGAG